MIKIKFLSVVLSFCMILSLVSMSAMAAPTLELGDFSYSSVKISVNADTGDSSVSDAMVYVYKSDGEPLGDGNPPVYMDFVTLTEGAFENKEILLPLDLEYASYVVSVYYKGSSSPLVGTFNYYSPSELLEERKSQILAEIKLAASSDASVLSDAFFDVDSAGGSKMPTNETVVSSSADLSVYNTVENKLEVYNRMIVENITSLESFDELISLFEQCAREQKEAESRVAPVVPGNPSTDTSKPGNTTGSISVSRPSGGGSGSLGGGSFGNTNSNPPSSNTETPKTVFTDMKGHWAEKYVSELSEKKIINGYEDGTFKGENKVSRAELTKMLVVGFDINDASSVSFSDVEENSWYYSFVAKASGAGVINGFEGYFNPDSSVTRQDAALMLYRILKNTGKLKDGKASFADDKDISDYALSAVASLGNAGIFNGDTNGNFNPKAPITRAEVSAVICRALDYAQLK